MCSFITEDHNFCSSYLNTRMYARTRPQTINVSLFSSPIFMLNTISLLNDVYLDYIMYLEVYVHKIVFNKEVSQCLCIGTITDISHNSQFILITEN